MIYLVPHTHIILQQKIWFLPNIGDQINSSKIERMEHASAWVCHIYDITLAYVNWIYDPCVLLHCPSLGKANNSRKKQEKQKEIKSHDVRHTRKKSKYRPNEYILYGVYFASAAQADR